MIRLTPADIDRGEMLGYLGYRGQTLPQEMTLLLEEAVLDCLAHIAPMAVWRTFPIAEHGGNWVCLDGASFRLMGSDIGAHLLGAKEAILLAATLGTGIERRLQVLRHQDMAQMLAVDAAAGAAIEAVCNQLQSQLETEMAAENKFLGSRFSPGYGNLPLALQPDLLLALNATKRIGLTSTADYLLLPRKSVTAIIGVFDHPPSQEVKNRCTGCLLRENCQKRKDGICCGHPKMD